MTIYTDEQIVDGIFRKDQKILNYIYKTQLRRIENFILNKGGDKATARDVFQEAMMIIYLKARDNKLTLSCAFSTYLYAVCKNLFYQNIRDRLTLFSSNQHYENTVEEPGPDPETEEKLIDLVRFYFNKLSKDCKKVLELHFSRKSLTEICRILGYKDEKYASDRKYHCKKTLFMMIKKDPKYKQLIDGLYPTF